MTSTKKPKRHHLEAFRSPRDGDWYLRQVASNKSKIAATEGYVGGRSKVVRAAQAIVNGFNIPVVRLNIVEDIPTLGARVLESRILRAGKPSVQIDVTAPTPEI